MNINLSISKRAIRTATAIALLAVMSVIAISLLMSGAGGATAFNSGVSDTARHMPIPAQYTAQCSNGTAVPNPISNRGLVYDCAALLASKEALEGTTGNLNWSADRAISDWRSVIIVNNRVSSLGMGRRDLNGAIPAELGNLANLTFLDLSQNLLTGAIPAELGNLDNLRQLRLYQNRLTGTIPVQLGNLANLRLLWLEINQLTGAIPAELGNLDNLRQLTLNHNQLTGNIPTQLGNLDNLRILNLRNNRLTGAIPAELGNLDYLTRLELWGNQFTGCIPRSLRASLEYEIGVGRIELPFCAVATATPTATSTPRTTATPTPTATSVPRTTATPTPTPTRAPGVTPVATPTPTATLVASNDVMGRLTALERQVAEIPELRRQVDEIPELKNQLAILATRVAQLEGGSAIAPPSPIPTAIPSPTPSATPVIAPGVTPSPTATSVAGTSGGDACVTQLAGSASVNGSWSAACLSANPPTLDDYYARFYTFTLDAAARVTITLSSATAAPYLYLLDSAGTDGAVRLSDGDVATSVAITANLQPGAYTIEATTYYSQTPGDFTLELEIR